MNYNKSKLIIQASMFMKQKIVFLTGMLIGFHIILMAQAPQLAKVTPPSPNAAALKKYGDIPVSPYIQG